MDLDKLEQAEYPYRPWMIPERVERRCFDGWRYDGGSGLVDVNMQIALDELTRHMSLMDPLHPRILNHVEPRVSSNGAQGILRRSCLNSMLVIEAPATVVGPFQSVCFTSRGNTELVIAVSQTNGPLYLVSVAPYWRLEPSLKSSGEIER
ncbi:hypothetical protein M9H77_09414 [Catharanthus roseus]|uniref:Uncharacterized protein n=1 Tax=Catharanthus roseus TaxID=4058 RepID=A0ACC0C0X1_CATRO|nr:hypothetical protein M9H77_09414 [Catharanthus roseus]